jgi:UDP-3-O-[3-hydroxymyristoyl] glucosamine N-acyltransferase
MRLQELADRLGATLIGDGERNVVAVRPLDAAGPEDLSFLHNPKYAAQATASRAGAILARDAETLPGRVVLVCAEPYLALAKAIELLHPAEVAVPGVHPTAVVAEDADIGAGASIGPCAVVGPGCRIGKGTVVGAGCVLGRRVEVGEGCLLHPRVVVEDGCRVGDRCILHAGVVIGSDGYGFATVAGVHHKVPQVGIVVIEADVELGANVCVDRATLGETRIGRGTKVDNLVQIAHNVQVGEGCLLVAQVGISGSTTIGHHTVFAGQSGAAGHLHIGDRVVVGAKSAVYKDVPDGEFVTGIPARPHREWLKANAALQRLDQLRERLKRLEEAVRRLEAPEEGGDR